MKNQLTYASLVSRYGPGIPVTVDRPLVLASRLALADPSKITPHERNYILETASSITKNASIEGMLNFTFILTTAGANENDQFFVEDEIIQPIVYESPIGEPMDWDHDQSFQAVCGEIYASAIVPETIDRPLAIQCKGVIFSALYPEVAEKVRLGAGRWAAVSMEALPNPAEKIGRYLIVHMPKFVGAGLVRFPGNRFSKIEEVSSNSDLSRSDWPVAIQGGVDLLLGKW